MSYTTLHIKTKVNTTRGEGREGFLEKIHFGKHFIHNTLKKGSTGKNVGFFSILLKQNIRKEI